MALISKDAEVNFLKTHVIELEMEKKGGSWPAITAPPPVPPAVATIAATIAATDSAAPTPVLAASTVTAAAAVEPESQQAPPPAAVDEKYVKFVKMKKMNMPEGAIRQKMAQDGLSAEDVESFFKNGGTGPVAAAEPPVAVAAAAVVDEKFAKYVKMQRMLPEAPIRQKMAQDGLSPTDIDAFFSSGGTGAGKAAGSEATPPQLQVDKFSKYQKLAKTLPEGAIR